MLFLKQTGPLAQCCTATDSEANSQGCFLHLAGAVLAFPPAWQDVPFSQASGVFDFMSCLWCRSPGRGGAGLALSSKAQFTLLGSALGSPVPFFLAKVVMWHPVCSVTLWPNLPPPKHQQTPLCQEEPQSPQKFHAHLQSGGAVPLPFKNHFVWHNEGP